jgi:hypothetical protein
MAKKILLVVGGGEQEFLKSRSRAGNGSRYGTGIGSRHGTRIGSGSTVTAGKGRSGGPGGDTTSVSMKAFNGDILLEAQTLEPKDFVGDRGGDEGSRIARIMRKGTRVGTQISRSTGANASDPMRRRRRALP